MHAHSNKDDEDEDNVQPAVDRRKELESWIQKSEFGLLNGDNSFSEVDGEDEDEHGRRRRMK